MFHIMVVDDDKNTRRLLTAVLEAENYTVSAAENGKEALEVMDRTNIDLIVLDNGSYDPCFFSLTKCTPLGLKSRTASFFTSMRTSVTSPLLSPSSVQISGLSNTKCMLAA